MPGKRGIRNEWRGLFFGEEVRDELDKKLRSAVELVGGLVTHHLRIVFHGFLRCEPVTAKLVLCQRMNFQVS